MTQKKEVQLEESWKQLLSEEFDKPYINSLRDFLVAEKSKYTIYPQSSRIFNAFEKTPVNSVKVVILGQDPYHGPSQAHGLCFSVPDGIQAPPSLQNIFKEMQTDLSIPLPKRTNLEYLAQQGVLLLNATLTVRANQAGSHQNKGWEIFTDTVITKLCQNHTGIVFLLWGRFAQAKETLIDSSRHIILKAAHPSPLSAYNGFFGCKHFSKTNEILLKNGKTPINWSIPITETSLFSSIDNEK